MIVVGKTPDEIRISRDQYLSLLSRLDQATHASCPHEVELAYDLLDVARRWLHGDVPDQVDGQLELPLDWQQSAAR